MPPLFTTIVPGMFFLPALFQVRDLITSEQVPIDVDAREFMAGYDKRGAYRVGEGEKNLESWELIRAAYMTQWTPPASFAWRDLSYEVIGNDSVIVIGLFDWGLADGRRIAFSYTGLLVKHNGELRIRLEDESMSPRALAALNAGKS
jgi:hypothetical protein